MNDIISARDALVNRLRDAGLRVVTDQRDATPPCIIVMPSRIELSLGGVYGASYSVAFVAPDLGPDRAQDLLAELIEKAAAAVPLGTDLQADQITLSGGPPLPAYVAIVEM